MLLGFNTTAQNKAGVRVHLIFCNLIWLFPCKVVIKLCSPTTAMLCYWCSLASLLFAWYWYLLPSCTVGYNNYHSTGSFSLTATGSKKYFHLNHFNYVAHFLFLSQESPTSPLLPPHSWSSCFTDFTAPVVKPIVIPQPYLKTPAPAPIIPTWCLNRVWCSVFFLVVHEFISNLECAKHCWVTCCVFKANLAWNVTCFSQSRHVRNNLRQKRQQSGLFY